jgi:hypothetical protein
MPQEKTRTWLLSQVLVATMSEVTLLFRQHDRIEVLHIGSSTGAGVEGEFPPQQ